VELPTSRQFQFGKNPNFRLNSHSPTKRKKEMGKILEILNPLKKGKGSRIRKGEICVPPRKKCLPQLKRFFARRSPFIATQKVSPGGKYLYLRLLVSEKHSGVSSSQGEIYFGPPL